MEQEYGGEIQQQFKKTFCDLYFCLFVNPYFVFYPKAQHRNRLEIKSLIQFELDLALSGLFEQLRLHCGIIKLMNY